MAPSPTKQTTCRFGSPIFTPKDAPMPQPKAKPVVPPISHFASGPRFIHSKGFLVSSSETMIACGSRYFSISNEARSHEIGLEFQVAFACCCFLASCFTLISILSCNLSSRSVLIWSSVAKARTLSMMAVIVSFIPAAMAMSVG